MMLFNWCKEIDRGRERNEIFTPYCDYIAIIARWCARSAVRDLQYLCAKRQQTHVSHFTRKQREKKTFAKLDTFICLVSQSSEYSRQLIITRVEALCIDDAAAAAVEAAVVVVAAAAIIEQHTPKTITVNLRIFHSFALTHGSRAAALQLFPLALVVFNSVRFGAQSQIDRHSRPKIELNFPMFAILFCFHFYFFIHSNCILIFFFFLYLLGRILIAYLPLLSAS